MTFERNVTEWLALGVAWLIVAALIAFDLQQGHVATDAMERDRLAGQARVIEENLGQQLDGIDKALVSVRSEYARPVAGRSGNTSERLKILSDAIPGVRGMLLLDAEGTVKAASEPILVGRNFHERDYFAIPRHNPDGETLYVSPPFTSVFGSTAIIVGRVLQGPNGEFEGVVAAALEAAYFEVVVRSVLYARDMRVTLAHADGRVFMRVPQQGANLTGAGPDQRAGAAPPPVPRWLIAGGPRADAVAPSSRLVATRTVSPPDLHMDGPLVIAVSRSESAVFRPWREHAAELSGFFAVLLVATSFALHRNQRRRLAYDRLEASAASDRRLAAERLEVALREADLGLWDWDLPKDRFNQNELTRLKLGYAVDEIGPEGIAWRALFHPEDSARVLATIDAHFRQETEVYECEFRIRHKAGHWVWLLSRAKVVERDAEGRALRMAGTHMDITERKRIELELQHLNERLTLLSTTDGLTQVGNRRLFDQTLSAEWARAARRREAVALLMIDIDHFKDYNDRHGHPAGDDCLRKVARLISKTVQREGELVARYGGEEFALLLPGTDLAAACSVAARCLAALADAKIEHSGAPSTGWVTMSIGVASATAGPGTQPSSLLDAADAALYRAKRAGRGRYAV